MATFQTLPGFREFYPEDFSKRSHIFRVWRQSASAFGFLEYDAPILEPLDLYKAKSGEEIEGQLFSFTDKGGREVALRPEMTPTVCRLVGERSGSLKKPIKWFSIGDFYRYERMQKGRGRCFSQLNADIFGEEGIEAELEILGLLVQCFRAFGLGTDDFHIRLSDRNLWVHYLGSLGFDDPRIRALLLAVDRQEKAGEEAFAPFVREFGPLPAGTRENIQILAGVRSLEGLEALAAKAASGPEGTKLRERIGQWKRLLEGLKALGIADFVSPDLGVVRGLAYYTGFVFEAFDRKGEMRALAGGGRYDDLVEKLGGAALPAVGFGMGDMTFGLLLEQRGLLPPLLQVPDVYCVIGGPKERESALGDIQALRSAGFRVEYPFRELGFAKQFKSASESGARLALIYGADELARGFVKLKDMHSRTEAEITRPQVLEAVRSALSG